MYDGAPLDESLFDEVFDHEPQCNCECGCEVPVSGSCVDCSDNTGHQNGNGLSKYDQLNEITNNYLKERNK
jgi:hypothetical protein